jgi:hypothetical protein
MKLTESKTFDETSGVGGTTLWPMRSQGHPYGYCDQYASWINKSGKVYANAILIPSPNHYEIYPIDLFPHLWGYNILLYSPNLTASVV